MGIRGTAVICRVLISAAAMLGLVTAAHAAEAPAKLAEPAAQAPHKHRAAPKIAPYRDCCGEVHRYAYAEAWYGNQKIVAPVRRSGCCDQVQVPGGAWVNCVFSCEITMRKMRLEFWQDQGAGYNKEISPGYPREDFWGDRHGYLF